MDTDSIIMILVGLAMSFITALVTTTKAIFGIEDRVLKQSEVKTKQLLAETQLQCSKESNQKHEEIATRLSNIEKAINGKS